MKSYNTGKKRLLVSLMLMMFTFSTMSTMFLNSSSVLKTYASTTVEFESDYENNTEFYNDMLDLNQQMCEEGFVMMKNDNNFLPMVKPQDSKKHKVSIFGKNASNYAYFGWGSSDNHGVGAYPDGSLNLGKGVTSVYDAFRDSDSFEINETLASFYEDDNRSGKVRLNGDIGATFSGCEEGADIGETTQAEYEAQGSTLTDSYKEYNDAAIVMITRIGSEGFDLPKTSLKNWVNGEATDADKLDDARHWDDHYLQLDKNEVYMLQMVMNNFENIILLVNTTTQYEVGFLNDPTHYLYTDNGYTASTDDAVNAMNKIKSAFFIGLPGTEGSRAIPTLLDGTANPSGKLTDIWMRDFKKDPTWQNQGFGGNPNNIKWGDYFVHYEEDIYLGYRYYETRYITEGNEAGGNEEWYNQNVIYPFGHGLSYTTFNQTVDSIVSSTADNTLAKEGTITATVTVENTGSVAGKDVVQVYYNAPYYENGIQKAHVNLVEFDKTDLLQPGESQTLTITFDVEDMKSYDWNDANANGYKTYELEQGDYNIIVAKDSHDAAQFPFERTEIFTVAEGGFIYNIDSATGNEVGNLFDDVSGTGKVNDRTDFKGVGTYMVRDNFEGTFPTPSETKKYGPKQGKEPYVINEAFDEGQPWYSEEEYPNQATTPGTYEENKIKLWHLKGRDLDDPLWEKLLDQLTPQEMAELIGDCVYYTIAIPSIDKPYTKENDGPLGARWCVSIQWQSAPVSAQTFNRNLTYKQGRMLGESTMQPIPGRTTGGTYGPGLETHRSPFSGRNMEYYSEDPVVGGYMCAEFMRGAWDKGSFQLIKHFVLNNSETQRNSISTWASEQAIREIYAKAYEIVVKDGHCQGFMSAVSYLGDMPCTTSYPLLTGLLRLEWGFDGFVISDMLTQDPDYAIRAGNDLLLTGSGENDPKTSAEYLTSTQLHCIRTATKNILHVMCNSHVMNGYGGEGLDNLVDVGPNKIYAVSGANTSLNIDTVTSVYPDSLYNDITYKLVEGSNLPEGLTLNADGTITGVATTPGSYSFSIIASEDANENVLFPYNDISKAYTIEVLDGENLSQDIIYDSSDLGDIYYGMQANLSIADAIYFTADGAMLKDLTYTLAEGNTLPNGLTLENGVITGASYAEPGTYYFDVVASKEGMQDKTVSLLINIKKIEVDYEGKQFENLHIGEAVSLSVADATTQENIDIKYKLDYGSSLPNGLILSSTGEITGTPTKAYNNKQFTVVAYGANMADTKVTYELTVEGIVFENQTFDNLYLGKSYRVNLLAEANNNNDNSIYFELKAMDGNYLPTGITLFQDGTIAGTMYDLGASSFIVIAKSSGQVVSEATITLDVSDIYVEELLGNADKPLDLTNVSDADGATGCAGAINYAEYLLSAFIVFTMMGVIIVYRKRKANK